MMPPTATLAAARFRHCSAFQADYHFAGEAALPPPPPVAATIRHAAAIELSRLR